MKIAELLYLVQWTTLAAAISLLCFKYLYLAVSFRENIFHAKSKWFSWYPFQETKQQSNPRLWEIMQQNKRITTAMWVCIGVCIGLFMVNGVH